MKKFLPNLLIVFALALCGLNAYQWWREAQVFEEQRRLTKELEDHQLKIQGLEGQLTSARQDIDRLEKQKIELNDTIKSNRNEIGDMRRQIHTLTTKAEDDKNQIAAYKEAIENANAAIEKQNAAILKQNEDMKVLKELADERNALAVKFNDLATNYNALAGEYEKLKDYALKLEGMLTNAAAGAKGASSATKK